MHQTELTTCSPGSERLPGSSVLGAATHAPLAPAHAARARVPGLAALILAFGALSGCGRGDHLPESLSAAELVPQEARQTRIGPAAVAELPRRTVATTYPSGGRAVRVAAGSNLQAALDAARPGDVLLLAPGATYTGEFVLRNKGAIPANAPAGGWIVVRTDVPDAALGAAGTRMTPSRARSARLARIVTPSSQPAIATASGAHHWRLTGLEVTATGGREVYSLVDFGSAARDQSTLASVPHSLIVDRSYIHGLPRLNLRRCLNLNSASSAAIDSWLGECHSQGGDSQAILGLNGPGPFLIQNNTLEAGHMAFMFGGGDPAIPQLVPSDITIRGNHMTRPPSWKGVWQTKTIAETKNARRLLLEGNLIENVWADAQVGYALHFKSVNQDGGCSWCTTSDVTVRHNRIRNVGGVFNIAARPEPHPAVPAARFTIHDNVADAVNVRQFTGPGDGFLIIGDVSDMILMHNTILNPTGRSAIMFDGGANRRLVLRGNLLANGQYGIIGSGKGSGSAAIAHYAPDAVLERNVLVGGDCNSYSKSTFCPARLTDVGFAHLLGGDYRLTSASGYRGSAQGGRSLGADIDRLPPVDKVAVAP